MASVLIGTAGAVRSGSGVSRSLGLVNFEAGASRSSMGPESSGPLLGFGFAVAAAGAAGARSARPGQSGGFKPRCEGPAIVRDAEGNARPAASQVTGGFASGEKIAKCASSVSSGAGCDVLAVKRKLAPVSRPTKRGRLGEALGAMAGPARERALQSLGNGFYARTTRGPRAAVWTTISKILERGFREALPLDEPKLLLLAAALKEGGYRAAMSYLYRAKQEHVRAGYSWSEALQDVLKLCVRSVTRGLGPGKSASAFLLEEVAKKRLECEQPAHPIVDGGPIAPFDAALVASAWMMRGLEAASVLGEQVEIGSDGTVATIDLGPTKMNPSGRGCPRALRCSCGGVEATSVFGDTGTCPVCALVRILEARKWCGLGEKHCLLCDIKGRAVSSKKTIESLKAVTGDAGCSEHSLRKSGAQFYARKGVPLFIIQFLGRWGSLVVAQYVGNAFLELASKASLGEASGAALGPWGGVSEDRLSRVTDLPKPFHRSKAALAPQVAGTGEGFSAGRLSGVTALPEGSPGGVLPAVALGGSGGAESTERVVLCALERWWASACSSVRETAAEVVKEKFGAVDAAVGGVRAVGPGRRTHAVLIGGTETATELWRTRCGWRFARAAHTRVPEAEVDCKTCRECLG